MDKDTTTSTFVKLLNPLNLKNALSSFLNLDAYVKKLTTEKWLYLMIFAQLHQLPSRKQLVTKLQGTEDLQKAINLESISDSQLSRKDRNVDPNLLEHLFTEVVQQMKRGTKPAHYLQTMGGPLYLVDASTISLCLSQCQWATFRPRQRKGGVKIHLRTICLPDGVLPDKAVLQAAIHSDRSQMNELVIEPGALYIFDRGYNDYEAFDHYCRPETLITFVTRLKSNAVVEVTEELPVVPGSPITREARVRLGSGKTRMAHELRLIETTDSKGKLIQLIANDWGRSAEEIGELYRKRWQIELFFKWAKQHLQIKKFYGQSERAVYNQIWIALITYCLLRLLQQRTKSPHTLFRLLQHVRDTLFKPLLDLIQLLHRKPTRTSRGRRRVDPEEEFRQFVKQLEEEGMESIEGLYADVMEVI